MPRGPTARLAVIEGTGRGRKYTVHLKAVGTSAVIGRSVVCEVMVDDTDVSRRHARLTRTASGFCLEDLGSSNGTAVNGETIAVATQVDVHFGDRIRLADKVVLELTKVDRAEEEIQQRQRFQTIGRLGVGLAHDFNNMQAVISAGLDYLLHLDDTHGLSDERVRDTLTDILKASDRASQLARGLMTYASSDREGFAITDASRVVDEVMRFARRTFGRQIEVVTDITPNLNVIGSGGEIHQVLMNLAINARDAMEVGGTLTASVQLHNGGAIEGMALPPGLQHVLVTVADTGSGMEEHVVNQMFEPFFTTKKGERGFGLGLAMVRDIVAAHGGTMHVASVVGEGTTFRLAFPAAPSSKKRRAESRMGIPAVTAFPAAGIPGGARVLVVDDEEMVRATIGRILEGAGAEIVLAPGGSEAVSSYAQQASRPDLVIVDLDMPGMTGEELIATLLELDGAARILIASAHHGGERETRAKTLGAVGFVAKPFNASNLVAAVIEALQAPAGIDEDTSLQDDPPR